MDASRSFSLKPNTPDKPVVGAWSLMSQVKVTFGAFVAALFPLAYALAVLVFTTAALWHAHRCIIAVGFDSDVQASDLLLLSIALLEGSASFLLLRHLLAPKSKTNAWQVLARGDQPEFYELLQLVTQRIQAPMPAQVVVDSSADLRVEYIAGWRALFQRRLRLRMGMALPVALQTGQLAAVLAHELAFFRKGQGARSAAFIRGVHQWFVLRIRHDPWMDWLAGRAKDRRIKRPWRILARMAWAAIWLSLRPLRLLFALCRICIRDDLRAMVFKADGCACKLVGSEIGIEALARRSLALAEWRKLHDTLMNHSSTDRLPDNIPLLIARDFPEAGEAVAIDPKRCSHWLDMAPADGEREERIRNQKEAGIIEPGEESTQLFLHFHEASRQVTYFHYQNDCGLSVTQHRLVAIEETVHEHRIGAEIQYLLNQYYRGLAHPERAFCGIAEEQHASRDDEMLCVELQDCREWLDIYGERNAAVLSEWTKIWRLVRDLEMAHLQVRAGLPVHKPQFAVDGWTLSAFEQEIERQRNVMDNLEGMLRQYEGKLESRLACALELLWRARPEALPPKLANIRETLPQWVLIYEALGLHLPVVRELITHFHAFQALGATVAGKVDSVRYVAAVQNEIPRLIDLVQGVLTTLSHWPYPFLTEEGARGVSLADYIAPQAMRAEALCWDAEAKQKRSAAQRMARKLNTLVIPLIDRYLELYHQSFGWVTKAADLAEWHFLDPFEHQRQSEVARAISQQRPVMHVVDPSLLRSRHADPELAA